MTRIWLAIGAVALLLLWWAFARTITLLIVLGVIVVGVWGWWEIRELRRVMRDPPK